MNGPKDPTPSEARKQDDLADNPGNARSQGEEARSGSGDAGLIAGGDSKEGDVETGAPAEPEAATADVGLTND